MTEPTGSRAMVEMRSQKSRGSGANKFGGPDRYVAVQIVPEGVTPLTALAEPAAQKRGIQIRYFGAGYRTATGPRSALGLALAEARAFASQYNDEHNQLARVAAKLYGVAYHPDHEPSLAEVLQANPFIQGGKVMP